MWLSRTRSKPDPAGRRFWRRLSPQSPQLEAEVVFACRHEYAETIVDVLARRTRIAFLDVKVANQVLPRVLDIMAAEHNWGWARRKRERAEALRFLDTMYLPVAEEGDAGDAGKNTSRPLEERILY